MLERLPNTTIDLLIPTLFFAFTWWIGRLYELTSEGNIARLPEWMQAWSKSLAMAKKTSRQILALANWWIALSLLYVLQYHLL